MHQLARKVEPIHFRFYWSNSPPTGKFHRTGRHTALLWRKHGQGYPLPQPSKAKSVQNHPRSRLLPSSLFSFICRTSLVGVPVSQASPDVFLALDVHAVEARYVLTKRELVVCRHFLARVPARLWAKLEKRGLCFQLTHGVCHHLADFLDILFRRSSRRELFRHTAATFALHRENRLGH